MYILVSSWQGRAGPLYGFGWKDDGGGWDGVILGLRQLFFLVVSWWNCLGD